MATQALTRTAKTLQHLVGLALSGQPFDVREPEGPFSNHTEQQWYDILQNAKGGKPGPGPAPGPDPTKANLVSGKLAASEVPLLPLGIATSSRILYVQGYGQSLAGKKGSLSQPYRTIALALADAVAGDTIEVWPGGTATDELGRSVYSENVNLNKSITIQARGTVVCTGEWQIPLFPGAGAGKVVPTIRGFIFRNMVAVLTRRDTTILPTFVECEWEGLGYSFVFNLTASGSTDKITQTYRRCRWNSTLAANPTNDARTCIFMQGRDDAGPVVGVQVVLEDCSLVSLNNQVVSGQAGVTTKIILRGTTTLSPGPGQPLQRVVRNADATPPGGGPPIYIKDNELFIDERPVPAAAPTSTVIRLTDYGVIADGVTDNATALMNLRAKLATVPFRQQPHYTLVGEGVIAYSNNRWLYGLRSFVLDGGEYLPLLVGETAGTTDQMFHRTWNNGEMLQTNVLPYKGGKDYMDCYKIQTVAAGEFGVVLQDKSILNRADLFFVGAGVCVTSKETVFRGYPRGDRHFEKRNYITSINRETGAVGLRYALKYEHRADNPDYSGTSGGGSGIGRIIPLDHPLNPYPDYAEFRNLIAHSATATSEEGLVFRADKLVTYNVVVKRPSYPSENLDGVDYLKSTLGGFEFDKLAGDIFLKDTDITDRASNGGGCRSITMVGGSIFESFQPNAPIVKLEGVTFIANTNSKPQDPCLMAYAGMQPMEHYEIARCRFGGTAANRADCHIQTTPTLSYTIQAVREDGAIVVPFNGLWDDVNFALWKSLDAGFPFWRADGGKGGRVRSLTYDKTYVVGGSVGAFIIKGSWARPAVGEVWKWRWVKNFIDRGGHQSLNGLPLFSNDTAQWKNNQSQGPNYRINFSGNDLKSNNIFRIQLDSFLLSAELQIGQAQTDGKLKITANPEEASRTDLVAFSLVNTTPRKFDQFGVYGLATVPHGTEPGLDQYVQGTAGMWVSELEIYCGNIPATGFTDFSLLIDRRTY